MIAKVQKIAGPDTEQSPLGFWIKGQTREPIQGQSIYLNPTISCSRPGYYKGCFAFFVSGKVNKMIKTSWGYLYHCEDSVWALTWEFQ